MKSVIRRDFLKLGAAGLAGVAVNKAIARPKSSQPPSPQASITSLNYAYLFELGSASRIDPASHEKYSTIAWALPSRYEHLAPALLSPLVVTPSELFETESVAARVAPENLVRRRKFDAELGDELEKP